MDRRKHTPIYVAGGCFFILLMALSLLLRQADRAPAHRTLADIRHEGTLRALTDGSSTGAARGRDGQWHGFQYEILKRFADSLGVRLAVTPVDDLPRCIGELTAGHYDLVATYLPPTTQWAYAVDYTRPLLLSRQMLVQRADTLTGRGSVTRQSQLAGDTVCIPRGSPHLMRLRHLSDEIADTIHIIGMEYTNPEKLAAWVAEGRIKHTIVHEQLARKLAREHPCLDTSLPVSLEMPCCWAVDKQSADLLAELDAFLDRFVGSLEYWKLYREYY